MKIARIIRYSLLLILLLQIGLIPTFAQEVRGRYPLTQGFGRFGRFNDDGLQTLNVSPSGIETADGGTLRVRWGESAAKNSPTPIRATVRKIDPTEKRLLLIGGGKGAPTALRYSLLYPGIAATFGKRLVLRCTDSSGKPLSDFGFSSALSTPTIASIILRRRNGSGAILVLLPAGSEASLHIRKENGALVVEGKKTIGEARFATPFGISEKPEQHQDFAASVLRSATKWNSLPIPVRQSSWARLSPDGRTVTITETFTGKIAPLPPVLAFAIVHGYPATVQGRIIQTECLTALGRFSYVRGNRLRYTLPVPPTDERGYLRTSNPAFAANAQLLNALVGHLGGAWATNAVDLGYAGMTNAQSAWAYLNPTRRRELGDAWKTYLPLAWSLPPYRLNAKARPWKIATEPFTHQSYLYTYFIDGPGHLRYDIDWGNALPIYGLQKYAQYTGDWKFVRTHWGDVRRVYRYFDLGDDWAWMTVVNADHGYSTGTGDPLAAAYCAAVAGLKMARVLKDHEQERHFAVRAARVAVPTVARLWYTNWARGQGTIGKRSIVVGYSEQEGFTTAFDIGRRDPWTATTLLSGDGVLPELFALYRKFARPALRAYEKEYASAYPHWFDGNVHYPFETTYKGNSVYVTFPHLFSYATILDTSTVKLQTWLKAAQTNRNNAWIAPNVIAEIMSRPSGKSSPAIILTDWEPAAYRDGFISQNQKQVSLRFTLPHPTRWRFTATFAPFLKPKSVWVNGQRVGFLYVRNHFQLDMRRAGKRVNIEIVCSRR